MAVGSGGGQRGGVIDVGQTDLATESRRPAKREVPPGETGKNETSYRIVGASMLFSA